MRVIALHEKSWGLILITIEVVVIPRASNVMSVECIVCELSEAELKKWTFYDKDLWESDSNRGQLLL